MGALSGTRLTVTDSGRSIRSPVKPKHCIKRAGRLLSNPRLHPEREPVHAELTRLFVGSQTRPIIIVDWSDLDDCQRHHLLRVSVPVSVCPGSNRRDPLVGSGSAVSGRALVIGDPVAPAGEIRPAGCYTLRPTYAN